jgi:GT2 family glycosyltransferase/glycosyltransferase involved in cell wall biosynthesis
MKRMLVVSSRFPWPAYSGDRLRAAIWLSALAPHGEVALVAPPGEVPRHLRKAFRFYPAAPSPARGLRGAAAVIRRGLPFQSLLTAPYAWRRAIVAAQRDLGSFDATVLVLARADPWVREALDALDVRGVRILDAIDSLRRSAAERCKEAPPHWRWFWRNEERRLARAEDELSRAYERIVVVSDDETGEFGGSATAVSMGIESAPLDPGAPRRFDFGFWGQLGYFANADAARWLLGEIWPAIRERHPATTLAIAGAGASRSLRRAAERAGVTLLSPVDDMAAFARSVRVALLPVRYGSGTLMKVLEAAAAGCAIVATPHALRGVEPLAPHVRIAADAPSLTAAACEVLSDDALRAALSARSRAVIESRYSRERTLAQLAALAGAGEGPAPSPAQGARAGMIRLSMVIPTYNTAEMTLACCRAATAAAPAESEIIVVDDGSTDGTGELLAAEAPGVTIIRLGTNRLFAAAANAGMAAARGEIVLLLNSDAIVEPGAPAALIAAFAADPRLGIAGAALLHDDGTPQWSGGPKPTLLWLFVMVSGCARFLPRRWPAAGSEDRNVALHVAWVSGAAMAFRRAVWDAAGPLRESYRFYAQDLDFCVRAGARGWGVRVVPEARVRHAGGATLRRARAVAALAHDPALLWLDLLDWGRGHYGAAWAAIARPVMCAAAVLRIGARRARTLLLRGEKRRRARSATAVYASALRQLLVEGNQAARQSAGVVAAADQPPRGGADRRGL